VKPGYKTTEFWLSAAAAIVGLVAASGVFPAEGEIGKIVGMAVVVLASLGYSSSRGQAKAADARASDPRRH